MRFAAERLWYPHELLEWSSATRHGCIERLRCRRPWRDSYTFARHIDACYIDTGYIDEPRERAGTR
ncbi:MAG: hypothetical protein ACI90M_004630 [Candidatus Azotimanducaceae bacterium]|jgi:hypothetical protein